MRVSVHACLLVGLPCLLDLMLSLFPLLSFTATLHVDLTPGIQENELGDAHLHGHDDTPPDEARHLGGAQEAQEAEAGCGAGKQPVFASCWDADQEHALLDAIAVRRAGPAVALGLRGRDRGS